MEQGQQKHIDCDGCGVSILEQCAIEENGQFLCGECILRVTKKEVIEAEKISQKHREHEYEIEKQKIILQKKKRSLLFLIVLICVFILSQWIMRTNQPEPVQSVRVDYSTNLYAAKALITIALHEFVVDKQKLPETLNSLVPHYLPQGVDSVFKSFNYQKQAEDVYELEIATAPSNSGGAKQ